jgi:ABC-type Co2+ transport system permease subunit
MANFGVLQKLIVPGDAAITAQNIAAAQGLFRLAIGAFFLVAVLDVVIGWALYIRFQAVNRSLSLLAALFRVVYATMLGVALTNLVSALQLVGGADFLKAFGTDQLWNTQMMVFAQRLSVRLGSGIDRFRPASVRSWPVRLRV